MTRLPDSNQGKEWVVAWVARCDKPAPPPPLVFHPAITEAYRKHMERLELAYRSGRR